MRYGCCLNMVASEVDGIGIEKLEKLAEFGFDYVELPLAEMMALSDSAFQALKERIEKTKIRCETCNNFFPKTARLTGSLANEKENLEYVKKALVRAAFLGVEYVVFGSGGAKNVPDGFSMEAGYQQVVGLLKQIDPIAKKNGITVVIEPLRRAECNLINTFAEGCHLAKDVDCEHVKVLVDFYHLSEEHEPVENLLQEGREYLRHVHFARANGRVYPKEMSEETYQPFFDALKAVGYNQRISVEAYAHDFDTDAPAALLFLHENI